jgi:serine/threonine protein kinase
MGCSASVVPDFHGNYVLGKKIGKGSFTQVHVACTRKKIGSNEVVVKIGTLCDAGLSKQRSSLSQIKFEMLRLNGSGNPLNVNAEAGSCSPSHPKDRKKCLAAYYEACVWATVGAHPNCVRMRGSFFDDYLYYIVLEKHQTSLISYVTQMARVSEKTLAEAFAQMLCGIRHIHSRRILHQDIKPSNFVVGGGDGRTIKLTDFRSASYVPKGMKVTCIAGTPQFRCPEMVNKQGTDLKGDLWSFGVVSFIFLCGDLPYSVFKTHSTQVDDGEGIMLNVGSGVAPDCNMPWLSKRAVGFLSSLLQPRPDFRPSAATALEMPFIANCEEESQCLLAVVKKARKNKVFDEPDLMEQSSVDVILERFQRGELVSSSKALDHGHANEFLKATPVCVNQTVETFFSLVDSQIKPQVEDAMSTDSTTCSRKSSKESSSCALPQACL